MAKDLVSFELKEHFGVISVSEGGWSKELNLVSWFENEPKFDIREWSPDHERMSRGITLTESQAKKLFEILKSVFESGE